MLHSFVPAAQCERYSPHPSGLRGVHGCLLADLLDGSRGEPLAGEQPLGRVENEVRGGDRFRHTILIKRSINERKYRFAMLTSEVPG